MNRVGCRYVLIGGFAVNYYGLDRATHDIDFLVDSSQENVGLLKEALSVLEDNAAADLALGDIEKYVVVRVQDEITVDLLGAVGDIRFENAKAIEVSLGDVTVPVADLPTLIATKQGSRGKDISDLAFLLRVQAQIKRPSPKVDSPGKPPPPAKTSGSDGPDL
ncbi:MAG: nucleotidyl transferase AbiEii/AbiGii toxin family protein [Thermaerobacter sp.]|nr:nucleotidyl transferase AbiEii/AbiGii toxin family protein [Thermaerobacter sp.]